MADRPSSYKADMAYTERLEAAYLFSFEKSGALGREMSLMLDSINGAIATLADEIKNAQKKKDESVTLHFVTCSKKGCHGCPHPR